ncbi:hypothetical protein HOH11_01910 [Candidatus Woesearchaeota archaeon]|jgi:hypothetical protein|nr:hypothetical protein [Candidatus Woesearchaeota archaeon]MBT6023335.1 hypothetical protein [Candidatus Woesearchaeota archaeon]
MVISPCLKYVYDFKKEIKSVSTDPEKRKLIRTYTVIANNERCPGLIPAIKKEERKLLALKVEKFKAALRRGG